MNRLNLTNEMRLFQVSDGQRVRLTSKLIRWVEHHSIRKVGVGVTWEGTTTDKYFFYKGEKRRLLVDHTVNWPEYGIWQKDTECEIIKLSATEKKPGHPPHGVLVDE